VAELVQRFNVVAMAFDRWRINDLLREFDGVGLGAYAAENGKSGMGLRLVPWGQGYRDMAPAIDALERAVMERQLVHPMHPILNWNMTNAVATTDPAGNRKVDKEAARFRIDGAVALAMLMGLKSQDRAAVPVDPLAMIA
jgi:phage terminase large subunit-like protein